MARPLHRLKPHCPEPYTPPQPKPSGFWFAVFAWTMLIAALVIAMYSRPARSIDLTGLSDTLTDEQRDWVKGLRSGHGVSCCDDSDGIDPVWDIKDGRYRVFWEGGWRVVSAEALLTEPNRIGVARAWMGRIDGQPFVRCFLPGATG